MNVLIGTHFIGLKMSTLCLAPETGFEHTYVEELRLLVGSPLAGELVPVDVEFLDDGTLNVRFEPSTSQVTS